LKEFNVLGRSLLKSVLLPMAYEVGNDLCFELVGFGRAARTRLFGLFETSETGRCAPPPIAASLLPQIKKK
jgi:hypothetical protein